MRVQTPPYNFDLGLERFNSQFEPDLRTRAFGRALDHFYVRSLRMDDARVIPVSSSEHNALRVKRGIF